MANVLSIDVRSSDDKAHANSEGGQVPIGKGPPTRDELRVHYPPQFTWTELKTFVNSGDLSLMKRNRNLHKRYEIWVVGIKEKYGSINNYLLRYRLRWGQADTLSVLSPGYDGTKQSQEKPEVLGSESGTKETGTLPPLPSDAPLHISGSTPPEYISVIYNDWPGPIPSDVDHFLVWSRVPICNLDLVHESVRSRVGEDGLWGFTGNRSPPPSPSTLPACLPALAEWGITLENMKKPRRGTDDEEAIIAGLVEGVNDFVRAKWPVDEYETAWFLNPPRLRSVLNLDHVHLYARRHPK